MRLQSLLRAATAAAILGLVTPTVARAQSLWDLVGITGTGDLGSSVTLHYQGNAANDATYGVITVTSSSGFDIYGKNGGTADEKGLGLCQTGGGWDWNTWSWVTNCANGHNSGSSYEIGDLPTNEGGYLTFDFSGLLVDVQSILLSSITKNEDYAKITASSNCSGSSSSVTDNNSDNLYSLTTSPYVTSDCVKFASGSYTYRCTYGYTGNHTCSYDQGDYLVSSIWTDTPGGGGPQEVIPEPASMTLLATGLVGMMAAKRRRKK